jgi:UDP-2-acetamido-3-amino-2,3-dideoxy-glucuronate N-acetyltransferase
MSNIYIHETANVSKDSKIGDGTKIWINSQIREKVVIGENCIISKDTYIDAEVKIGNNCKIQNSVSVYQGVTIEDDVFVGPNACFTNDKVPRAFDENWKITPTLIKKGASIGANATIVCGIVVGEYSMVASGSVVTKDVEAYSLVMGNPAKHYSYIDKSGNKIEGKQND